MTEIEFIHTSYIMNRDISLGNTLKDIQCRKEEMGKHVIHQVGTLNMLMMEAA